MFSFLINYPLFFIKGLITALYRNIDVVHSHDFDTLPLAFIISWLRRIPLVFDAHENYACMISIDVPHIVPRIVLRIENILTRRADLVITVSEVHATHMIPNARHGVILVENCINMPTDIPEPIFEGQELKLLYVGTLEPMRYIIESIDVTRTVNDCIYKVAGWGRLEEEVRKRADDKQIQFLGFLQHKDMLKEMASCDVVICLLDPSNRNYIGNSPTKIYEAMSLGIPVLTTEGTTSGDLVNSEGCGLVIEWSENNYRKAIEVFRDPSRRVGMGEAGRIAAKREYNWDNMKQRLLDGYLRILEDNDN